METRILGVAKNPGTRHMLRGALSVARQAHISKVELTELFQSMFDILMKIVCVGRERLWNPNASGIGSYQLTVRV